MRARWKGNDPIPLQYVRIYSSMCTSCLDNVQIFLWDGRQKKKREFNRLPSNMHDLVAARRPMIRHVLFIYFDYGAIYWIGNGTHVPTEPTVWIFFLSYSPFICTGDVGKCISVCKSHAQTKLLHKIHINMAGSRTIMPIEAQDRQNRRHFPIRV